MKLGVLAEEEAAVESLRVPIATDLDCNSDVDNNYYLVADNAVVGRPACAERSELLQRLAHGFPAHHYYYYYCRHRRGDWDDGSCCWDDPSH